MNKKKEKKINLYITDTKLLFHFSSNHVFLFTGRMYRGCPSNIAVLLFAVREKSTLLSSKI